MSDLVTRCLNCGLILTLPTGRLRNANFFSSLPPKAPDATTTWARCDACAAVAITEAWSVPRTLDEDRP